MLGKTGDLGRRIVATYMNGRGTVNVTIRLRGRTVARANRPIARRSRRQQLDQRSCPGQGQLLAGGLGEREGL